MAKKGDKPKTAQKEIKESAPAVDDQTVPTSPEGTSTDADSPENEDSYEIRINSYKIISAAGLTAVHNEICFYRDGEPILALNGNAHDNRTGELLAFAHSPGHTLRVSSITSPYSEHGMELLNSVALDSNMTREDAFEKLKQSLAASEYINRHKMEYVVIGGLTHEAQNSNSVAAALLQSMGYKYPEEQFKNLWAPGTKRQLLPDNWIPPVMDENKFSEALQSLTINRVNQQVIDDRLESTFEYPYFPNFHDPNKPEPEPSKSARPDSDNALQSKESFDVSGIDSSPRAAHPTDLVKAAMSQSKILMIGNTNHYDSKISNHSLSPEMLRAAKNGGATHIAVEVDKGLQWRADQYMAGRISRETLTKSINNMYMGAQNNADGSFTRSIVGAVDFAKNNNMKMVFADPHNGWGNKPSGLSPEEEEKWELENSRDRFNDTELVSRLNTVLSSDEKAKVYLTYGDAHFSVDNGNKENIKGTFTKMSMYSNRADLESFEKGMQNPNDYGRTMGWMAVKPDLVYFVDEQTFSTTKATSDSLKKAVNDIAPKPQQDANLGFTSSLADYGLDQGNGHALTSATSFNQAASAITPAPEQAVALNDPTLKQRPASNAAYYLTTGTSGPT